MFEPGERVRCCAVSWSVGVGGEKRPLLGPPDGALVRVVRVERFARPDTGEERPFIEVEGFSELFPASAFRPLGDLEFLRLAALASAPKLTPRQVGDLDEEPA